MIEFHDPYVSASKTETTAGLTLRFPLIEADGLAVLLPALRSRSREVFAALAPAEIQDAMTRIDSFFADPSRPEVRSVVDLIQRVDGFSRHDIERFGLGIFRPLATYGRSSSAGSSSGPSKRGAPSRRPSAISSASA